MFRHPKEQNTAPASEITPTIRYFIELHNGNTDLDQHEKNALEYAETIQLSSTPLAAPDLYFVQKASNKGGRGIIPPHVQKNILAGYKSDSLDFVQKHHASELTSTRPTNK